jgi:hypothetical protein
MAVAAPHHHRAGEADLADERFGILPGLIHSRRIAI